MAELHSVVYPRNEPGYTDALVGVRNLHIHVRHGECVPPTLELKKAPIIKKKIARSTAMDH